MFVVWEVFERVYVRIQSSLSFEVGTCTAVSKSVVAEVAAGCYVNTAVVLGCSVSAWVADFAMCNACKKSTIEACVVAIDEIAVDSLVSAHGQRTVYLLLDIDL